MKILFLTFYFEPDLCAGSFRNTSIFNSLCAKLNIEDELKVITTHPNRYDSFKVDAIDFEQRTKNITINRIRIPNHGSGLIGQIKSFFEFYKQANKIIINTENFDIVFASSSRLFTAFLGARLAKKKSAKLYLDIRDIFRESIIEIFKNPIIKVGLDIFLRPIEYVTFKDASHINLVSEGFKSYFLKYKKPTFSFYTNGIDEVFLDAKTSEVAVNKQIQTVLYAGNIGEGQGLHIILPKVAKEFSEKLQFIIIGDGGAKQKLNDEIEKMSIKNIEIRNPINRQLLIEEYLKADFLFLHLNDYKAFERVLPSKLFEYGVFNKPIIAGVGGYAALFLKQHMSNSILFDPGDSKGLIEKLNNFKYATGKREEFIQKFSRSKINNDLVDSLLRLSK